MKLKALIVLFLMGSMSLMAQKSYQLQSPDKKLQAVVTVGDDIRFSFTHDGTEVLAASPISMTLQNGVVLGASPKVSKVLKAAVDKVIPSPFYKKTEVQDIYNEMTLSFRGNYGLVFRMYNDGLAYRFTTKMKNDIVVVDEEADYNFSSDHTAFAPYVNITELSRLGRDTLQVLQAIEILNQNKVSVFIQNYNIETLTPEGEINPMSQFLITILAEVARMERKTIRERVASGYQNFRSNGGKVGRKVGYTKSDEVMREEYAEELRLLKRGYSLRNTSKLTGTSINTLRKLTQLT